MGKKERAIPYSLRSSRRGGQLDGGKAALWQGGSSSPMCEGKGAWLRDRKKKRESHAFLRTSAGQQTHTVALPVQLCRGGSTGKEGLIISLRRQLFHLSR